MERKPYQRIHVPLHAAREGVSGWARLEREGRSVTLCLRASGLSGKAERVALYAYAPGREVWRVVACAAPRESALTLTCDPFQREGRLLPGDGRLGAVMLATDDAARQPLLLGVFPGVALPEARNAFWQAMLEPSPAPPRREIPAPVCVPPPEPPPPQPAPCIAPPVPLPTPLCVDSAPPVCASTPAPLCAESASTVAPPAPARRKSAVRARRCFPSAVILPAIDPLVHVPAEERPVAPDALVDPSPAAYPVAPRAVEPPPPEPEPPRHTALRRSKGRPLDALKPVEWPESVQPLQKLFAAHRPRAPFGERDWRYIRLPMPCGGSDPYFWVGVQIADDRVRRVAYAVACSQDAPPPHGVVGYRWRQGVHGGYWTLTQTVRDA